MQELVPGLMLVHGNRAEQLRDVLVAWQRHAPLAPLENEVVLVQSNGIAQWLRLAIADRDGGQGIAAALDFVLPARFLWRAYRAVLGAERVPEDSPLDAPALVWRLLRLLPRLAGEPVYAPLARFMAHDPDMQRRHQLAQALADLYDQYQVYRADWLAAWAAGDDVLVDGYGRRQPLPADQRWQPALWRTLLAELDPAETGGGGRAGVHAAFMQAAQAREADDRPAGLPRRVLVFGISSMPAQGVEALVALSRWTQILMCVNNPCAHYWADIVPDRDMLRSAQHRQARRAGMPAVLDEDAVHQHAHPLLASWGKQGRDFVGLLDQFDDPAARARYGAAFSALHQRIDVFEALPGDSLLQQLQDDIRDLRPLAETRARWPAVDAAADESIRFHVAHGPLREVEILHDQLLRAFDGDPGLRPRDVIVMVPDIAAYAPHIRAVFGMHPRDDDRAIPHAIVDQSARSADPLVLALEQLLALPDLRITASQLLDWLDVPAVRARFGIAQHELPRLHAWVGQANVRWGLDERHRARFSAGVAQARDAGTVANSWHFGLRRMLLGYAAGPDAPLWKGIAPHGEAGGLEAAALGPLSVFVAALERHARVLSTPATPQQWRERLLALAADFFQACTEADERHLGQFRDAVQGWYEACEQAGLREPLPVRIAAEHCLAEFDRPALSQGFLGGAVTFATLMPMRAIPFRHVCLLGMQDGEYPRSRQAADFDLMARHYRPGDRSRREDDRYLFLEALLSARDRLHVSWVGRSAADNTVLPPSVLVAQLRDHLDAGWRAAGSDAPLSTLLTVEHPLQAFSRRYLQGPGAGQGPAALFTYAREWHERSAGGLRAGDPAAAQAPLAPPRLEEPLALDRLARFLRHPVREFFRQRLMLRFDVAGAQLEDRETFQMDALQAWGFRDQLLQDAVHALRAREDPAQAVAGRLARLQAAGALPAGVLGEIAGERLCEEFQEIFQGFRQAYEATPGAQLPLLRVRRRVQCGDQAIEIEGTLADLSPGPIGWQQLIVTPSHLVRNRRWQAQHLVLPWVRHVAANLGGEPVQTRVFSPAGHMVFDPLEPAQAGDDFDAWVRAWVDGMCLPLPALPQVSIPWCRTGQPRPSAAEWPELEVLFLAVCERDPWLRRAFSDAADFAAGGRFEQYSDLLYGGLAEAMSRHEGDAARGAAA